MPLEGQVEEVLQTPEKHVGIMPRIARGDDGGDILSERSGSCFRSLEPLTKGGFGKKVRFDYVKA